MGAQAIDRIWEEIQALSLDDQQELRSRILAGDDAKAQQVLESLRGKGLIMSEPRPGRCAPVDFQPIKVSGEPVSETLIRERR
ncbi:MAG TPA: hypothetical protein VGN26_00325 [Armatimonadota bacterium]|jgi:hypothetical protein